MNRQTPARCASLLYHEVTDNPDDSGFSQHTALPYKLSVGLFDSHLEAIAESKRLPVLVDRIDFDVPGNYLLLTFDDGGCSAMHIAERLEKLGWRGHFFVSSAMVGSPGFLSPEQIRELHGRGHCIGSHSHSHPRIFSELSPGEIREQWNRSTEILEDILGLGVDCASIPGGHISKQVLEVTSECGISHLFTSEPTTKPWRVGSMLCLGRVCARRNTPAHTMGAFAMHRNFGREMLKRKAKNSIKTLLWPIFRRRASRNLADKYSADR